LADKAKEKGIGIIMDQVANHIGSLHPWMSDLPSEDWVNQWPEFTQTNHMKVSRFDPHGAEVDRKQFTDGWFVETMPDLNQRNEKLARYLIQNSIWWVEYLGLHGIRMDTWPYPDKQFLADWTKAILDEYPNFNIVGEEWVSDPSLISYWQAGTAKMDDYTTYLPSIMDFPLQSAVVDGLMGEGTWRSSMTKIYESLANDYMYGDLNNIMIFPDNHDMSRIYTRLDEDFDKWKMATRVTLSVEFCEASYRLHARCPHDQYPPRTLPHSACNRLREGQYHQAHGRDGNPRHAANLSPSP
jgi:glycosidase